jgi:hypothetical protein
MTSSVISSRPGTEAAAGGAVRRLPRRRRNLPLAVAGVLLVAVCALMSAAGWLNAGHREAMLALARPVPAGSVLTAADLQQVRISADASARLVPASAEAAVVGRTAGEPLPAGTLLSFSALGTAGQPAAGQAELGVQVSPGQYPASLAAGATVEVLDAPSSSAAQGAGSGGSGPAAGTPATPLGRATVLGITQGADSGGTATVVELQLPQPLVPLAAAAASAGQVSLAQVPAGGQ